MCLLCTGSERTLAGVEAEQRRRVPLRWLLAPIVALTAIGFVADIAGPGLINERPLLQMALNARNRYLLLASPQVDAFEFFLVGFLRLTLSDPIGYVLGRQYGEAAVRWLEKRSDENGAMAQTVLRWFGKAAPVVVVVAPNLYVCALAGATGMRPRVFVPLNVAGTVGRLLLFRLAGEAFREELLDVLGWIQDNQWYLIAASFVLVSFQVRRARSQGTLESVSEMEEEIEAEERALEGGPGPDEPR